MVMLAVPGPLEQAPEAFNRVGVNRAVNVGLAMIDDRVRDVLADAVVTLLCVRDEQ